MRKKNYVYYHKNKKYHIYLVHNKKKKRRLFSSNSYYSTLETWREFKTEKKPRFTVEFKHKRHQQPQYEIILVGPADGIKSKVYTTDELGRSILVTTNKENEVIRKIYPYWEEEKIYDYQTRKHIRYHELLDLISNKNEIGQVFTLNKNIFIQTDTDVLIYGNKNIHDCERLFNLLREDMIEKEKGNFIFVKDIATHQRKSLYDLLESKGFSRDFLFRHYSY